MSEADLFKSSQEPQNSKAEVLETVSGFITNNKGQYILTDGGLEIPANQVGKKGSIKMAVLKPVTKQGEDTLNRAIKNYERNNFERYVPVTTLAIDSSAAAGGKRNKSKKPKRRNSRSKRRKTLSKRRR